MTVDVEDAAVANTAEKAALTPPAQDMNTATNHDNEAESQTMSKNQLKKLKRKQKWEDDREARKVRRKEKTKQRKARKRDAARAEDKAAATDRQENGNTANGESGPQSELKLSSTVSSSLGKRKRNHNPELLPITFIYDCAFDDLMTDTERISLAAQLTRAYSDNRKAVYSAGMMVSSFGGKLKERFDGILTRAHEQWKGVEFLQDDFVAAAERADSAMKSRLPILKTASQLSYFFQPPERAEKAEQGNVEADDEHLDDATVEHLQKAAEVVYLTSDSPYTLDALKPFSTYVIGGLVDKNRHKGICYKRACDHRIKTAKLPIGEYMRMSSRQVLATNHVGEIMLRWLESGDWGLAFDQVIPKRKGGVLKERLEHDGLDGDKVVQAGAQDGDTGPEEDQDAEDSDDEDDDQDEDEENDVEENVHGPGST